MSETNLNDAISGGIKKATENVINRAVNALIDCVKKKYRETQVTLGTAFVRYLDNATCRYNKVQTLATGTDPRTIIGVDNIYVPIGVLHHEKEIDTSTAASVLRISNHILIQGTGGIGKSMLMRYFFLDTADKQEYVPILLELRKVNNQPSQKTSILELIYDCMKKFDVELPREQFEYSLQSGKYLFLFDGLDEVKEEFCMETTEKIQEFVSKYPRNSCIITSRPRNYFSPLETFTTVESMTLNKEQAVLLASKIHKGDEKSEEFCRQLENNLYKQHKSFAENPLLLSMMFLTFMRNCSIPDHLADFYQKAYDALYSSHDSHDKGYYRRDFRCKTLDERGFKQIFSYFCFHTYLEEIYEFSELEILSWLEKSLAKFKLLNISAQDYLHDLCHIVCMVVKEGDMYRFSHRSFQSYFAACYTSALTDEQQKKLFKRILENNYTKVWGRMEYYDLMFQIEKERFAKNALEERLREFDRRAKNTSNPDVFYLKSEFSAIGIEKGSFVSCYCSDIILRLFIQYMYYEEHIVRRFEGDTSYIITIVNRLYSNDNSKLRYISWKKIDDSNCINQEERELFYLSVVKYCGIQNLRYQVASWFKKLDQERRSFESSNFIDDL